MNSSSHDRARRALVVRGGWDGHQPVEATDLFIPHLEENGFTVEVHDSPEPYADPGLMAGIDLVMQCVTMSTITADQLTGLRSAVEAGTGLAGWHGGIADSYRNSSDYLHLIGGQFACHPGKHPDERVGDGSDNFVAHRIEIRPDAADHPITTGIGDFDLVTEQYWVLADDYCDVLATTTQQARPWDPWHRPVTSPAIWTREWGRGRVFVATPGHQVAVLRVPEVTTLVKRGLLWAARR
ncbi:MAG TPA: ThuA domain-containing protein [Candidatus Avipropionibacterium avicola]|uniref:ThuA domain-containing protein n=1 Tax=Candidatus Avipropionibacterium avicola TaxID=2840701 RepID=A0A9D1KMQ3_9ACTN|nr:ThuA domain-containing protein [Candidatus Avipropionibacterium avicola]